MTQNRKSDNPVVFYIGLVIWLALFIFNDLLIWA